MERAVTPTNVDCGRSSKFRIAAMSAAAIAIFQVAATAAFADDEQERSQILLNRWQEDWSRLADPQVSTEPFDDLKYVPLSTGPESYLALGLNLRERIEANHAQFLGLLPENEGVWLLSRLEAHADLHLTEELQVFAQLQSAFATGKDFIEPVDQNRLDIEQFFVGVTEPFHDGKLTFRLGRQLFAFDLQRFLSSREGTNLRQPHDAAYLNYERGPWRVAALYSQPVITQDRRAFDDYSDDRLTLGGVLIRKRILESSEISLYAARYTRDHAIFLTANGDERRNVIDLRFDGRSNGFGWDIEAMYQTGRIGPVSIEAWAFGSLLNYTFSDLDRSPTFQLSIDGASGDHSSQDSTLGTFNPLFPNGFYVAGYSGYVNVIHIKPSVVLHPTPAVNLMIAVAGQWRETTADAVYVFPSVPLPGTAGIRGSYTGSYGEVRADWIVTPHFALSLQAVHFVVADSIQQVGGSDANHLRIEARYAW